MHFKSLQDDEDIMIIPADKGNAVVVVNTNDYKAKVHDHLSNASTY